MKVYELIRKLSEYPQDLDIVTEGCDCINTAEGVTMVRDFFGEGFQICINRKKDDE